MHIMWYYLYQIWKVAKHNQQTSKRDSTVCEEEIFWTGNRLYGRRADLPDVAQPQDAGCRQHVKYGLYCWGFGEHSVLSIWASHRTVTWGNRAVTWGKIVAYTWVYNSYLCMVTKHYLKRDETLCRTASSGRESRGRVTNRFSFLLHLEQGSETHSLRSVTQSNTHYLQFGCFK